MPDDTATILRLLAEGHLSVAEADRLLGALDQGGRPGPSSSYRDESAEPARRAHHGHASRHSDPDR